MLCGCVCDDLTVTLAGERVVDAQPPCPIAQRWFACQTAGRDIPPARLRGRPVPVAQAVEAAADMLARAQAPLIYGLSRSSTPGQRSAVRLADFLRGTIDTTASTCHAPSIMAVQAFGESTATLGEIKNRSDLVVYWGSDPVRSHPRHMERLVESRGLFVPEGRLGRHVVAVDVAETETTRRVDSFIRVRPGGDFELIWALRTWLSGHELPASSPGGAPRELVVELGSRLKSSRYGAVFFGLGLTRHGVPHANIEALLRLVTDLNAHTRFVVRRMRIPGDVAGADSVLAWQTGYPFSVNFARGYPRYNPGEYSANALLERSEVDAVLLVGSEGVTKLSPAAQQALRRLPLIVLDYPTREPPWEADVHFTTAVYGLHRPGTAYRMDEVPIPLRQLLHSPLPADHEILDAIRRRIPETLQSDFNHE
jgi:formylmethanofuran dehydrogenase subunit B